MAVVGCDGGYPIAATFCDEQCELLFRACPGSYDPAECVAGCEDEGLKSLRESCPDGYDALLECLRPKPITFCLTEMPNTVCAAEERAYYICLNGGEEEIARVTCLSYCSYLAYPQEDCAEDKRLACEHDCVSRGLGRVDCEAERSSAISCFFERSTEDPNACDAWQNEGDAASEVSCSQERGRLAACGME